MEPFRVHLYVCTQQKPEGVTSCSAANSGAVLEALDREIQARGLDHDVQLTTCGCLGLCDERPMMVIYPQGTWYRRVQAADVPEIVESLRNGGRPIERLVWNDGPAMRAIAIDHTEKYRAAKAAREAEARTSQ
jgi:(2Fe-2S) ferredoxin